VLRTHWQTLHRALSMRLVISFLPAEEEREVPLVMVASA
jgi:hypothetical protein